MQADVDALVELGVQASVIESPISDGKLAALGVTRDVMLERIAAAVRFATERGIRVAFFGVDSSRAEPDFFRRAYETAVDAGAQEVVVVDTLGIATPEAAAYLVGEARDLFGDDIPIHWHGHDDFGLATAAAVAAVQAGATWVQGTVNGMGERAGNADLIEVALTLEALYGIPTRLDLTKARALAALVQERSGYALAPWKPVTGDNLFVRESGAVAAQFHDPPAIEPYSSGLVGAERGIVLGKKSGLDSIRIACERLGLDVPTDAYPELLAAVKTMGVSKQRLVTDAEFRRLGGQTQSVGRTCATARWDGCRAGLQRPPADRRDHCATGVVDGAVVEHDDGQQRRPATRRPERAWFAARDASRPCARRRRGRAPDYVGARVTGKPERRGRARVDDDLHEGQGYPVRRLDCHVSAVGYSGA